MPYEKTETTNVYIYRTYIIYTFSEGESNMIIP